MPTATPTRMLMRLRKLTLRSQASGVRRARRWAPSGSLSGGTSWGSVSCSGGASSRAPSSSKSGLGLGAPGRDRGRR